MELQQLRYFVAAAELGNVTRAAAQCRVAQPSLSQQLKKLEDELGVKLFDRLGRGIALTDAGHALLPRARRILADVRDTRSTLARDIPDGDLPLALGAIPTIAPYLLPPALSALQKAMPHRRISVREDLTQHLAQALADNELDCALVSTPLNHELLEIERLAEEELLVALPKTHPAAKRPHLTPADLSDQPTIALEDIHCLGQQIDGFCNARHISPRILCRTTQLTTILQLVSLGMGLSLIPEMAAAAEKSARCRYLRLRPHKPTRQIAVAWRRGRTRSPAALQFVAAIKSHLHKNNHSLPT